jgi:hypothetical protein
LDLPPLLTTPFHLSIIKFKSMNKIIWFYISHEFLWISREFLWAQNRIQTPPMIFFNKKILLLLKWWDDGFIYIYRKSQDAFIRKWFLNN